MCDEWSLCERLRYRMNQYAIWLLPHLFFSVFASKLPRTVRWTFYPGGIRSVVQIYSPNLRQGPAQQMAPSHWTLSLSLRAKLQTCFISGRRWCCHYTKLNYSFIVLWIIKDFMKWYHITVSWTGVAIQAAKDDARVHAWHYQNLFLFWFTLCWMAGIPAQHFLVQERIVLSHPSSTFVAYFEAPSVWLQLWDVKRKFQYEKQFQRSEWMSEHWSCACNYHYVCEILFWRKRRTDLQLNVSAC